MLLPNLVQGRRIVADPSPRTAVTVRKLMRLEVLVACQTHPKARTTMPAADLAG